MTDYTKADRATCEAAIAAAQERLKELDSSLDYEALLPIANRHWAEYAANNDGRGVEYDRARALAAVYPELKRVMEGPEPSDEDDMIAARECVYRLPKVKGNSVLDAVLFGIRAERRRARGERP